MENSFPLPYMYMLVFEFEQGQQHTLEGGALTKLFFRVKSR